MYKITYMGNGFTTKFSFNFPFYKNTDIIVAKNNTVMTTGYIVVGTSAGLNADIPYTGGNIVFTKAPLATDSITISRKIPLSRLVDYQPTEKINPTLLNQDQNRILEILKDFDENFEKIDKKYGEIINTESIQTLIQKIDTVSEQIENLGDISNIISNINSLKNAQIFTQTGKSAIANLAMPSNTYIDFELPSAGGQYTAPGNGYIYVQKASATSSSSYNFLNLYNRSAGNLCSTVNTTTGGAILNNYIIAKKGDKIEFQYNLTGATSYCRFIYAVGL